MTQIFKKEVSTKTSAVVFGVLIIACLFAFYVSAAWNEPTQPPPAGNVPAPINTGTTDQIKSGGLKVEGVFSAPTVYDSNDPNYYININGMAVLAGPVGIGPTSTPSHQLEVAGVVKFGSTSQPTQDITNGLMYYDQTLNKFRCYQNGWVDCIGSAGGVISNKGLQKVGNDFGIKNCAADQIVKYNASGQWDCAADETGAGGGITCGGTCSANQVAFFTSGTAISSDAGLFWDNINKRLGVGTQNPHIDLDIESDNSTSYTGVEITNIDVSTRRWAMLVSNNAGSYAPSKGFAIRDISVGSTRLVIDTSGKIGVGTITPAYKLDVSGGDINTNGIYRKGGVEGIDRPCESDQVLKGATVSGGIVTSGTCAADETGAGGGITCGGTCSANQVAFFTSGTAISSDAGLFWDNVNKRLRISKSDGTSPTTLKVQNTFGGATADTRIILGTSNDVGVDTVGAVLLADRTDVGGAGSTDLKFQTSSSTTMNTWLTIKADGKIGVGTITPAYKLDISGGDINTSGVYRQGGINVGTSKSCQPDEVLKGATVNGGIVTGGTCLTDETGAGAVPSGVIVMWSGSAANIPTGWALCNGANGTPDLRNKFIMGAGGSYNPGDTGGTTNHRHLYTTTSTAGQGYSPDWSIDSSPKIPQFSHQHSGTTGHADNLPPYYALAFIMKL